MNNIGYKFLNVNEDELRSELTTWPSGLTRMVKRVNELPFTTPRHRYNDIPMLFLI